VQVTRTHVLLMLYGCEALSTEGQQELMLWLTCGAAWPCMCLMGRGMCMHEYIYMGVGLGELHAASKAVLRVSEVILSEVECVI
jgi:hypothetical protein